jgi:hypothetical protein
MKDPAPALWQELSGEMVVLDTNSPYIILGRLEREVVNWLVLTEVDVHDLRDTPTTREKYILDSRVHGIRANRKQAWVRLQEVVAVSRLSDVIVD